MEEGSIWLAGGFSKNAVSQERMKRCSFVSFNFIMDYICTEILSIENKSQFHSFFSADNYLLKVNNRNIQTSVKYVQS